MQKRNIYLGLGIFFVGFNAIIMLVVPSPFAAIGLACGVFLILTNTRR